MWRPHHCVCSLEPAINTFSTVSTPYRKRLTHPRDGSVENASASRKRNASRETLFAQWSRPDPITSSFRWDPTEDVRYALRATDPTDQKTKATTQYGANRLAAIGVSALTVVPRRMGMETRLAVRGGPPRGRQRSFLTWPIWRHPASLASIKALLTHPRLDDAGVRSALGIVEVRQTQRISSAKNLNFTRAVPTAAALGKKRKHTTGRNTGRHTSSRST